MKTISLYTTLLICIICFKLVSQPSNTESFDGATFVPTGWTNLLISGTNSWTRVTAGTFPTQSPRSGLGEAKFNSYNVNGGVSALVSPVISFATRGAAPTTISFWMYRDNGFNTTADKIDVYMNTDANTIGATFLGTVNRAIGLSPAVAVNGWYEYSFSVPATFTTTTNYFILRATSAYGNNIFIDDVSWTAYPTATIDMMATALVSPSGNFGCFGNNQSVTIQIKNNGSKAINFAANPVIINANVSAPPSNSITSITSFTLNSGTLGIGSSSNITISTNFNMLISGSYIFNASTNITSDINTSNDAMVPVTIIVSKVNSFPYETDFSALPSPTFLVQQVSGSGNWSNITTGNLSNPTLAPIQNSGSGFAYFNSYSYSSGTVSNLILPNFDFSATSTPNLDLWVSQDASFSSSNDKLDILVSTDGGNTWSSSLLTIKRYNSAFSTPGWKSFTASLFAYAGMPCVRIAIKATSAFGNNMAIDYLKVYNAGSILPVKLISFDGSELEENTNLLSWKTAEEINTKLFKLEKSTDGVNFNTIYTVFATGEQVGKTYFFIDTLKEETPLAYYRLVSVDDDNSSEVFKIVSIERTNKKDFSTNLYPNPTNSITRLSINKLITDQLLVELIDNKGTIIYSETLLPSDSRTYIDLPTQGYTSGIYFVKVTSMSNTKNNSNHKLLVL